MQLTDCEALIFDSDGVLVDSEVINIAAERELLAEIGLTYDYATYVSRFVGLSNPDFYAALRADYAAQYAGHFPDDFGERLTARVWPRMEAELKPIDGVADLVRAFDGEVAVASSAPFARLKAKLTITGLVDLFEPHLYSADHVANGKPSPELFLHAAKQLGIQPQNCAVIEDSINGVRAASAAGMFAIGFTGGGHADAGLAGRLSANGARLLVGNHFELLNGL